MDPISLAIPPELLTPTASRSYQGEAEGGILKAGVDTYRFEAPITWSVDITNTGDALLVTGVAEADAVTDCARCLDPVHLKLIGDIEGFFLLDADGGTDLDDDQYEVLNADHIIDLAPLISSALLLEVPLVPLCKPDCKGLCVQCGHNLNEGPCEHSESSSVDDAAMHPFAALKDYHFEA